MAIRLRSRVVKWTQTLQVQVVLDPERDRHRTHPNSRHGAVADVHEVDAGFLQDACRFDGSLDAHGSRRMISTLITKRPSVIAGPAALEAAAPRPSPAALARPASRAACRHPAAARQRRRRCLVRGRPPGRAPGA